MWFSFRVSTKRNWFSGCGDTSQGSRVKGFNHRCTQINTDLVWFLFAINTRDRDRLGFVSPRNEIGLVVREDTNQGSRVKGFNHRCTQINTDLV
ncbi:hypothetical protein ACFOG5_21540 [Pedobacter fastidiosus]|uniref:hypothetical protein n=1 Tax=Pedobacter fastidiosus TaxID=2765361 RepID=UPI0036151E7F